MACPEYQQQTLTEPRIECNSSFFLSCNHLASTYYVLGAVPELRKHGRLRCRGAQAWARTDKEFLLVQW